MTKIVCFDTETTGLIPKGVVYPKVDNLIAWPHIVQFSFVGINHACSPTRLCAVLPGEVNIVHHSALLFIAHK